MVQDVEGELVSFLFPLCLILGYSPSQYSHDYINFFFLLGDISFPAF